MKRLHIHVAVKDLSESIGFYSTLFAAEPTVQHPDYAKWMLEDPRVNFAISQRGGAPGVQHLGIQVEDGTELAEVFARLGRAERPILEQKAVTCCYAKGDKQWINDPQGIAWETFLTHGQTTVYGDGGSLAELKAANATAGGSVCCAAPDVAVAPVAKVVKSGGCCAA